MGAGTPGIGPELQRPRRGLGESQDPQARARVGVADLSRPRRGRRCRPGSPARNQSPGRRSRRVIDARRGGLPLDATERSSRSLPTAHASSRPEGAAVLAERGCLFERWRDLAPRSYGDTRKPAGHSCHLTGWAGFLPPGTTLEGVDYRRRPGALSYRMGERSSWGQLGCGRHDHLCDRG